MLPGGYKDSSRHRATHEPCGRRDRLCTSSGSEQSLLYLIASLTVRRYLLTILSGQFRWRVVVGIVP